MPTSTLCSLPRFLLSFLIGYNLDYSYVLFQVCSCGSWDLASNLLSFLNIDSSDCILNKIFIIVILVVL